MSDEPTHAYTYEPGARKLLSHLRRYPRHYGALVLWAVAMGLVPAIASGSPATPAAATLTPPTSVVNSGAAQGESSATPGSQAPPVAPKTVLDAAAAFVTAVAPTSSRAPSSSAQPQPAPAPSGEGGGDEPTPAGPGGLELPPPPPVPVLPVPEELRPLVAAVSPLTSQGCSAVGLAAVVAAVVGPAAGDAVPAASLLPYLSPAYSACATFPAIEGERTVCAIDEQARAAGYPADASGLATTPNIIGIGVDVFAGFDRAIEAMTGQSPGIAAALSETLECRPDV